jgi:hypothetical protein
MLKKLKPNVNLDLSIIRDLENVDNVIQIVLLVMVQDKVIVSKCQVMIQNLSVSPITSLLEISKNHTQISDPKKEKKAISLKEDLELMINHNIEIENTKNTQPLVKKTSHNGLTITLLPTN